MPAPKPGDDGSYAVGLPSTTSLRITPVYDGPLLTGSVSLSEVHIDNLHPQRYLRLPTPLDRAPVDVISLSRDQDRFPCVQVRTAFTCDPLLREPGEDGDVLARQLTVLHPTRYAIRVSGSLRRTDAVWPTLFGDSGVRVDVPRQSEGDPAQGPGALADGDPSTTWIASSARPLILLTLPHRTTLSRLRLDLNPGAPASLPKRLVLRSGSRHAVVDVGANGKARLPHWRVRRLTVRVESTYPAFTPDGTQFTELGPGISELRINGHALTSSVFTTLTIPCGQGPRLDIGGTVLDTSLTANTRSLLRGTTVPLEVCTPDGAAPRVRLDRPDRRRRGADGRTPRRLRDADPSGGRSRHQPAGDRDPHRLRDADLARRAGPHVADRRSRCRRTSTRAGRRPWPAGPFRHSGRTGGSRPGCSRPGRRPPST